MLCLPVKPAAELPRCGPRRVARDIHKLDCWEVAERNADILLRELRQGSGQLLRSWKDRETKLNGCLENYAYLIEGLLELYQTTFDSTWFVAAQELAEPLGQCDGRCRPTEARWLHQRSAYYRY
jgi:hypothetical protein